MASIEISRSQANQIISNPEASSEAGAIALGTLFFMEAADHVDEWSEEIRVAKKMAGEE